MPATTHNLRTLAPKARLDVQVQAATALADGGAVFAPADTGYVVCIAAGHAAQFNAAPAAWLAPDTAAVLTAIPLTGVHTKLLRTLAPGPASFAVYLDEAVLARVRETLGFAAGVIDSDGAIRVRVPGESFAAALAARAKASIGCWEPADDAGRSILNADDAASAARSIGISPALVVADAPPSKGGPKRRPTIIALERTGNIRILSEGAYETRYVMKQSVLNVLFVCTGNTCRSPMAEAIAAQLIARRGAAGSSKPGAPTVHVGSAGVGAAHGSARTPEGNTALKARGFEPAKGASRPLTRHMIAEADAVYTMTRSHLDGVLALDPAAKGKAFTLDPAGGDIADPIGLSQDAYDDVAERLEGLIQERLKEWMA